MKIFQKNKKRELLGDQHIFNSKVWQEHYKKKKFKAISLKNVDTKIWANKSQQYV